MRSAVFLASASMSCLLGGTGMAHYIASGGGRQDQGVIARSKATKQSPAGYVLPSRLLRSACNDSARLLPPASRQSLLQCGEGLRWSRHQPAEALIDQLLDIIGVDMRVTARHAFVLADRQD